MSVKHIAFTACVLAPLLAASSCSSTDVGRNFAALSGCPNDPGFGTDGCYQGDWWMEFSVSDPTVTSIAVEVQNTTRVITLTSSWNLGDGNTKFSGGPDDGPVPQGTMI